MCNSVRSARRMLATGLLVLAGASVCLAADTYPYVGVVVGDNVNVRSGDSMHSYPVMTVSKGQRVTVQGESAGWLKIAPPTGTFSWVDKNYIERNGSEGTVTADRLWVRAGSLVSNERSAAQVVLNKGDKVTILGEDETFLKIQTPPGASLYIASRYVAREGDAAALAAATTQPAAAASQATASAVDAATPGIIRRSSIRPRAGTTAARRASSTGTAEPASQTDWQARYEVLENDLKAELAKPLAERNFAALTANYKAMAEQSDDEALQAVAKIRLKDLANLANAQGSSAAVARADAIFKKELEIWNRPQPAATQPVAEVKWDVKGVLKPSWVFTGNNTAKLYRLVNPATDTAVAYVQQTPELAQTLESLLGQYIAVRAAQQSFRPDWNVNLIVPADVKVAAEEAPAAEVAAMEDEPAPASQPAGDAEDK